MSFEVQAGEVVGIIGRNGAGKSTLLKILSRITKPTKGRVEINGRVGSLLEVGTGFHPELTGRENIYLNGSILGMSRAEITKRFDEIVAFAGIDRFLDTPVKRYSSGMYVRLAFAVAAHLEPELLVVDEVLAVGDAEFQQKCLGKMNEVAKRGRTVIFVSHNMGAVVALCQTAIVLASGKIMHSGPVDEAIEYYNAGAERQTGHCYTAPEPHEGPYFTRIEVSQEGVSSPPFRIDREIHLDFDVNPSGSQGLIVGTRVRNRQGVTIIHSTDEFSQCRPSGHSSHRRCTLPPYALSAGTHFVRAALWVRGRETHQVLDDVVSFRIEFVGQMAERSSGSEWHGVTGPGIVRWDVN